MNLGEYDRLGSALANAGLIFESLTLGKSYIKEKAPMLPSEPPAIVQELPEQAERQTQLSMKREPSMPRPQGVHNFNTHPNTNEQAADAKRKAEQVSFKEFFYKFLKRANAAQIEIFKAVMENPIAQTIEALLRIPFIPQMIKEEKEKEKEKWANTSDRDFCRHFTKNQKEFIECLKDLQKKKEQINKENP